MSSRNVILPGSGGQLLPQSCYAPIPEGALLDLNHDVWLNGKIIQHAPSCPTDVPSGSGWLQSATQYVKYYYFTQIYVSFYVPNPPSSTPEDGPVFFFWPGIEGLSGANYTLLQPVLQWNQGGSGRWEMEDYVISNWLGGPATHDYPGIVYPGDLITAVIWIDVDNPGASCNTGANGGANCNYFVYWDDSTSGHLNGGAIEVTVPYPLTYAQGAVMEAYSSPSDENDETGFPVGCSDFPGTSVFGTHYAIFYDTALMEWSPSTNSDVYDALNFMTTQYPNAPSGWLTDVNNNHVDCGDSPGDKFSIAAGCWFGNCNDYGFAVGY